MSENQLNRRTFLIRLGAGVAGGIGGFFLMPHPPALSSAAPLKQPQATTRPRMRHDIVLGRYAEMEAISYGRDERKVLCAINQAGSIIISKLDGRHTIDEIGEALKSGLGIDAQVALDAPVAHFVAQLGMLGFLTNPFYATIYYENMQTHGS